MLRAPSAELTNVDGQMPVVEEGIAAIRHQLECSKLLNPPSGRAVARLSLPLARALSSLWPAAAARATLASAQSIKPGVARGASFRRPRPSLGDGLSHIARYSTLPLLR
jgi:hypothetical protein